MLLFLNNITYNQMLKVPVLVQHYQEHHQRDRQVGLLDFLSMHYWGNDINDDDAERDNQLPFKHLDDNSVHTVLYSSSKPFTVILVVYHKTDFPTIKDHFIPDPALNALFRPPKV
jgi:hypothetical protein